MGDGTSCWIGAKVSAPMDMLLPVALRGLEAEDRALALAFSQGHGLQRRRQTSEGLSYHLFETTLAYVIFRSWLPVADVEWECPCGPGKAATCDLVVHMPGDRRILTELKWWNYMRAKTLDALERDVERLRSAKAEGRYLMCFWWNFDETGMWEGDRELFLSTAKDMGVTPRYLDRFPTRVANKREEIELGYFAMSAFSV